jgi:integrase
MGKLRQRFQISVFHNRTGTKSWRVAGVKRDGTRIRENFADVDAAQSRQVELEAEFRSKPEEPFGLRATSLSREQIKIAEVCFPRLDRDEEMIAATQHWLEHGRHQQRLGASPRLDDAVKAFFEWIDATPSLRPPTKRNLKGRLNVFTGGIGNPKLTNITPDDLDRFLANRTAGPVSRDNDRRAISRFFAWCMMRPRHWLAVNPCSSVRVEQPEKAPPVILSVTECECLLRSAERVGDGAAVPMLAVSLFAGLRPFEVSRLGWENVNLKDGEIRVDAATAKTKRGRVVLLPDNLRAWLAPHKGKPFTVSRRLWDSVKVAAGFVGRETKDAKGRPLKPWVPDVLRHTGVSHKFRACGSYGLTAEWAGNSEAVIKSNYQGRVSSAETAEFYALRPTEKTNP